MLDPAKEVVIEHKIEFSTPAEPMLGDNQYPVALIELPNDPEQFREPGFILVALQRDNPDAAPIYYSVTHSKMMEMPDGRAVVKRMRLGMYFPPWNGVGPIGPEGLAGLTGPPGATGSH